MNGAFSRSQGRSANGARGEWLGLRLTILITQHRREDRADPEESVATGVAADRGAANHHGLSILAGKQQREFFPLGNFMIEEQADALNGYAPNPGAALSIARAWISQQDGFLSEENPIGDRLFVRCGIGARRGMSGYILKQGGR
jgi:hypothetical protein